MLIAMVYSFDSCVVKTFDLTVVSWIPDCALSGNNLGQVVHTHLPRISPWSNGSAPGCGDRDCRHCAYLDSYRNMQSSCSAWIDLAFHPPWDGNMTTDDDLSHRWDETARSLDPFPFLGGC